MNTNIFTYSGNYSVELGNPLVDLTKYITIIGPNTVTIITPSADFVLTAVNSPFILSFSLSGCQWSGNPVSGSSAGCLVPLYQKVPKMYGTEVNKKIYGAAIAHNRGYLYVAAPYYNDAAGVIVVYKVSDILDYDFVGNDRVYTDYLTKIDGITTTFGVFGSSVVAADNYLMVGSPSVNNLRGECVLYKIDHSTAIPTYHFITFIIGDPEIYAIAEQGHDCTMSADGRILVVAGRSADFSTGAIWIFKNDDAVADAASDLPTETISTHWKQVAKLTGSGSAPNGYFSESVTITPAGNMIAVGAPLENGNTGRVYVFVTFDSGDTWSEQFVATGIANQYLGLSVCFDEFGTTLIAGAPGNAPASTAEIYTRVGTVWTPFASIAPTVPPALGPNDDFGHTVTITPDGTKIWVSSIQNNNTTGAVWKFELSGGVWTNTSSFVGTNTTGIIIAQGIGIHNIDYNGTDYTFITGPADNYTAGTMWISTPNPLINDSRVIFNTDKAGRAILLLGGLSTAISPDASYILINGNGEKTRGYLFGRTNNTWELILRIKPLNQLAFFFNDGIKVALSINANRFLVSERDFDQVAVYDKNISYSVSENSIEKLTSWDLSTVLVPTGATLPSQFGAAVAITPDGKTIAVGGPQDNGFIGAVWVFDLVNGAWVQQMITGAGSNFGINLALADDGVTLIILGAFNNTIWVYTRAAFNTGFGLASTFTPTLPIATLSGISINGSSPPYTLAIGAQYDNTVFVFNGSAAVWSEDAILNGANGGADGYGTSVSLGNKSVLSVGAPFYINNNVPTGSVYLYSSVNTTTWNFVKNLFPSGISSEVQGSLPALPSLQFGNSVSADGSGGYLAVGSPMDGTLSGAAYLFS